MTGFNRYNLLKQKVMDNDKNAPVDQFYDDLRATFARIDDSRIVSESTAKKFINSVENHK